MRQLYRTPSMLYKLTMPFPVAPLLHLLPPVDSPPDLPLFSLFSQDSVMHPFVQESAQLDTESGRG